MFGLDLTAIIASAIGGAVGGAIGGLLSLLFTNKTMRLALAIGVGLAGSVLLKPLVQPYLDGSFGTSLRANQFDAVYESEMVPALKKIPALERIFRDFPETEVRFRDMARTAYAAGGAKGLNEAAGGIGNIMLGDAFLKYMPRARGQDLMMFARTMADTLGALNNTDPEACILYQFGAQHGQALSMSRLKAAVGKDSEAKFLETMNLVVTHAADRAIEFDKAKGAQLVDELAAKHVALLTGKSHEVAAGERLHTDRDEAKAACNFAATLFKDLATRDAQQSELILRVMYAGD